MKAQVSKSLIFETDFSTPLTGFLLISGDNYVIFSAENDMSAMYAEI